MRKPAFAYFYGLCILISFSLLTLLCGGYQISIAYCLFSVLLLRCIGLAALLLFCRFSLENAEIIS